MAKVYRACFLIKTRIISILSQALALFNEYEIVIYKSNDFLSLAIYIMLWHEKYDLPDLRGRQEYIKYFED